MKIGVLTSSRADYGIYLPLLKMLQADSSFELGIIAFGTHLSKFHGYTIQNIRQDGFQIDQEITHILTDDSAAAITSSMAIVQMKFADIWKNSAYDLVFCLGDRYEMFAAVASGIPFNVKFAHLHGGETTLGAIDNVFRHSITLFSLLHFVSTKKYAEKVASLTGFAGNIFCVGSLSLDNLADIRLLNTAQLQEKFGIDFDIPTLLVTYHPETIDVSSNGANTKQLTQALSEFKDHQVVITMPNADTSGTVLRQVYQDYASKHSNVKLVENMGTQGYFSAMKKSVLVVGNSSSGIIEAASFNKYVVDIGDRQKGRAVSPNVVHCPADARTIREKIQSTLDLGEYTGQNIYHRANVAEQIVSIIKSTF